jgi:RNA polymerase primary sigma factor
MSYTPFSDEAEETLENELQLLTRRRSVGGLSPQSPLETYLREINETKLLTAAEEQALARRVIAGGAG